MPKNLFSPGGQPRALC